MTLPPNDKNHDKDEADRKEAARRAEAQANHDKDAPKSRAIHSERATHGGPETADPHLVEARANDSIGCQVILDPASTAALAARGGAAGSIEDNTAIRNANMPRIIGLSHDTVGGTVKGGSLLGNEPMKLHRPVPWYEPPAAAQTPEEVRAEAIAEIVSP